MGLTIVYDKAGSGKSTYCFEEIKKLINTEKKIYMITPEQFSFTAEKKLMETLGTGAVFNAEVITLSRMAYRVLEEVGGNNKAHLSKRGISMLLFSILDEKKKELKFLGKSEENLEVISNAISEFKKHGITLPILQAQIEKTEDLYLKSKLEDLNIVYQEFKNQIEKQYIDETDLLTILAEKLDQTDFVKNSIIFLDEFSGFTKQEYDVIEKMTKLSKQVTVTICSDSNILDCHPETNMFYTNQLTIQKFLKLAEKCEEKTEFIKLEEQHRFKTEELAHLEKNLFAAQYKKYLKKPENIQMFLAKNPYTEIEQIAKQIAKLVREEGYRYNDIGVISKQLDTYSSLIRAIFRQYEIPVFIDEKRDLNQNIIIQYILSIIEIFQKNWSYEAVLQYIKTGFVGLDEAEIFPFENYCRKWGIKYNKWKQEFNYGMFEESKKQEIEHFEEMRKQIVNPLLKLQQEIGKEKTVKQICTKIYQFFQEQGVEQILQKRIEEFEEQGKSELAKEHKMSYEIVLEIFDEMVDIFNEEKMTFSNFFQILKVGLQNSGLGKIPGTLDQVIIGDVERSRSHKVKAIFVLGVNDGIFPGNHREEGFLDDEEREFLEKEGLELAKGTIDQLYEENFNIYKAFTTAEEKIYVSYVSSDAEGKALRPSTFIGKIRKIFPKLQEKSDMISSEAIILTKQSTYEQLLKQIAKLAKGEEIEDIWYIVYQYYYQTERIRLEQDLKGLIYTNKPEPIAQEQIEKLYGSILKTSISKLEKYRTCPFSYFLQYGLRLKEKEELKIQTINTGTFMHEVIDEFFNKVKEEGKLLQEISEEELQSLVEKVIEEKLEIPQNYIFKATEKYKVLVNRLKRIIIKALKYMIQSILVSDFEVFGTEIEFSNTEQNTPIRLTLDNGKQVEITGKIDRVDIGKGEDGKYIRIIDYKSSAKDIDLNEVYAGLQIQLLTYMDAMCKKEDVLPAGVLYFGLLEQMILLDKKMSEEELEEKLKSNFKMKGLILSDIKVVKMQDKSLEKGSSKVIPAYIDSKGNLSYKMTSGVTKEQFSDLQKYVEKTIKEISKEILSGRIDLQPFYKKKRTPCEYCSYKSICGFQAGFCQNEYRYLDSKSKEEILEEIHKEVQKEVKI